MSQPTLTPWKILLHPVGVYVYGKIPSEHLTIHSESERTMLEIIVTKEGIENPDTKRFVFTGPDARMGLLYANGSLHFPDGTIGLLDHVNPIIHDVKYSVGFETKHHAADRNRWIDSINEYYREV